MRIELIDEQGQRIIWTAKTDKWCNVGVPVIRNGIPKRINRKELGWSLTDHEGQVKYIPGNCDDLRNVLAIQASNWGFNLITVVSCSK